MTATLQDSVNYASAFIRFMDPTTGVNNEPAITIANTIIQTIMNPPFTWRLNRSVAVFQTIPGQQDYSLNMTGSGTPPYAPFGFLETATVQPCATITSVQINSGIAEITVNNNFAVGQPFSISGLTTTELNVSGIIDTVSSTAFAFGTSLGDLIPTADTGIAASGKIFQLKNIENSAALAESSDAQRPEAISVQYDDGESHITFRFMGVPDNTYNVTLNYQVLPFVYTLLTQEWQQDNAGLSDDFLNVFDTFFVGHCMEYAQDSRAAQWLARGAAALIRKSEGLSEMDKAIFLAPFLPGILNTQIESTKVQQGNSARAQG